MAEIFLAGVLVSFVKLMAYGDIGVGSSFIPWCFFCVLQLRAFQCVDRRWLWDDIAPMPVIKQALKLACTVFDRDCVPALAALQYFPLMNGCAHVVRRKVMCGVKQSAMDVGITVYVNHALSSCQYSADYDYRFARVKAAVNHT